MLNTFKFFVKTITIVTSQIVHDKTVNQAGNNENSSDYFIQILTSCYRHSRKR